MGDQAGTPATPEWTNDRRQKHYDLRARTSLRLVAAVGGLSVIGTGDLAGSNLTRWWAPLVVTLLLAAGACLGLSWSTFSHGATVLRSAIDKDDQLGQKAWRTGEFHDPSRGETLYRLGTILIALGGLALVAAFWWSAVDPAAGDGCGGGDRSVGST